MSAPSAVILAPAGLSLTRDEAAFFTEADPWAFILFGRNCESPDQIAALTAALRETVNREAPVLIDQEGGRVQRLGPPRWPSYRPAAAFGQLYERDPDRALEAVRLNTRLIAADLEPLGITVDCLPVLDVATHEMTQAIGDRAFSSDPAAVAALGRAAAEGLMAGGVLPVIKHMPGHGRARSDSHYDLPVVEAEEDALAGTDFAPFAALSDLPIGMSAHLVYKAIDQDWPGTLSRTVVETVIRGHIGFDGLLLTDDIGMKALSGPFSARAEAALAAGCDIVSHCSGDMAEMTDLMKGVRTLSGEALRRADAALALRRPAAGLDRGEAEAALAALFDDERKTAAVRHAAASGA